MPKKAVKKKTVKKTVEKKVVKKESPVKGGKSGKSNHRKTGKYE